MKSKFISKAEDTHLKKEEKQWAEILARGNSYAGMLLIYDQKLCAVVHEVGVVIEKGKIDIDQVRFYASMLETRISKVLELLDDCGLDFRAKKTFTELRKDIKGLENNQISYNSLKHLPERIHLTSHELCDELYKEIVR